MSTTAPKSPPEQFAVALVERLMDELRRRAELNTDAEIRCAMARLVPTGPSVLLACLRAQGLIILPRYLLMPAGPLKEKMLADAVDAAIKDFVEKGHAVVAVPNEN